MKRAGGIIEQAADLDNLLLAFYRAQRGKQWKSEVRHFREGLWDNLEQLRQQLLQGKVDVGHYTLFTIFDPKQRQICAAAFPERVLHHALMLACHPYFERHLIAHTYATRIGKGTYAALDEAHRNCSHYPYVAKLDVRKYFDSIDHAILIRQIERMFKDRVLLRVLTDIIESYHSTSPGIGLPIGNLTSQYFANHYLSPLDHYLKEQLHVEAYVRYMDDMLLFGRSRATLKQQVEAVEQYAAERLNLQLKPPLLTSTAQGVNFLGYRLRGHCIGLCSRSRRRLERKLGQYEKWLNEGFWNEEEYRRHVVPLMAFAQHAYSKRTRRAIMDKVGHRRARTACCVAAVGTTTPRTAVWPIVTTTIPPTATTITGCGWSCPNSSTEADSIGLVNRCLSGLRHKAEQNERLRPSERGDGGRGGGCYPEAFAPLNGKIMQ